ncbi:MAG: hypothetical protein HQ538_06175 [Parcubacteria group bacterium]|nr:hypothetical protein [Parcubacteria group bacterium]
MNILPKDKVKKGQVLTEEDFEIAANKAYKYAVLGILIPIVEIEAWRHADRARKSTNPELVKKANLAMNIATGVFFWIVLAPTVIFFSLWNIFIGVVVAGLICFYIYTKKRKAWSRRKVIILIASIVIFLIYGIFANISGI